MKKIIWLLAALIGCSEKKHQEKPAHPIIENTGGSGEEHIMVKPTGYQMKYLQTGSTNTCIGTKEIWPDTNMFIGRGPISNSKLNK